VRLSAYWHFFKGPGGAHISSFPPGLISCQLVTTPCQIVTATADYRLLAMRLRYSPYQLSVSIDRELAARALRRLRHALHAVRQQGAADRGPVGLAATRRPFKVPATPPRSDSSPVGVKRCRHAAWRFRFHVARLGAFLCRRRRRRDKTGMIQVYPSVRSDMPVVCSKDLRHAHVVICRAHHAPRTREQPCHLPPRIAGRDCTVRAPSRDSD